jgi:hypothetical protein
LVIFHVWPAAHAGAANPASSKAMNKRRTIASPVACERPRLKLLSRDLVVKRTVLRP